MSTLLEIEDKYDVALGFVLPPLDGIPGVAEAGEPFLDELDAEYFDTADLRLARSKITLRRRTGGADAGWHLKLPGDAGRQEIHRPLGRGRKVPTQLRDLVYGRTRGKRLIPVARLHTTRTTRELHDAEGAVLASVMDDVVRAEQLDVGGGTHDSGAPQSPLTWRELEVELGSGPPAVLRAVADRLREAGAAPSERPSKLATALGERLTEAPPFLPALEGQVTDKSPGGEVIRSYLAGQLEKMLSAEIRVRLDEDEGIHDMRVATRRLRSTMGSFERLLDAPRAADLEDRLKALAGELGVVRDAEVLLERLLGELDDVPDELVLGPVRARIADTLHEKIRRGREALLEVMTGREYAQLVDDLTGFLADGIQAGEPASRKAKNVLPALVARRYRKLSRRAARAAELHGREQAQALHDTRKAAKQVRYAAEAVASAFGAEAVEFAKQAEAVQEVLGEHQDGVVAAERLREFGIAADAAAGESAFTFGVLAGIEHARGQAARDAFEDTWKQVSRKRYRRWLS